MRTWRWSLALLALVLAVPGLAYAQTAATGTVTGLVTDPTGAVVPGAEIELTDLATNLTKKTTSNDQGLYTLINVQPASYKVTCTMKGFRRSTITSFKVDVGKSYNLPFALEVGDVASTVEVVAATAVEIQTMDATVGNAVGGTELLRLPTGNRSAATLLLLQPLVAPGRGVGNDSGGQVAGSRSDQTTFLLDGGDSTSNTEGGGGYNTGFDGTPLPIIPVPVESIEEFRVGTTNPNATFGRSQGGQVMLVTKRGTNDIHGSVYWYHQNDNLNAAAYADKRRCQLSGTCADADVEPELIDNRYGFTLGGPIMKDRLFLFGHYEGRNFPRTAAGTRHVPSTLMRQGILQFRNSTGSVVQYNLQNSTGCGAAVAGAHPNLLCDPRSLGISPVVQSIFNSLPAANAGGGDGLNTGNYSFNVDNTLKEQFAVVRLDYKVNDTWNLFGSYRYSHTDVSGAQQLDITGLSGCTAPCSTRVNPLEPRYVVWGVNGQLNPRWTSETRFSWYRHWWEWGTRPPSPQVAGTAAAISLGGEGTGAGTTTGVKIADPYNIDTQNGRSRVWNGKDSYISENLTWLKGRHTVQFGGNFRNESIFHQRTDRVTGGLAGGPIFYLRSRSGGGGGSFLNVPAGNMPPLCSTLTTVTATTPCLTSTADQNRWRAWFATTLGLVDQSAQMLSRDGQFNALPLGTGLEAQVNIKAYETFFQDIWRMTNNFTFTYGITWQVQRPPTEELGRQVMMVYAATGEPVDFDSYYYQRQRAAQAGQILNPDVAFSPIGSIGGQKYVTNIDWNNVGPRVSAAWQPQFDNWFFGKGKTAIRGGWGMTYTRMNGVGLVMTPILGAGLGQILACRGPQSPTTGTGTCAGTSTPANGFRVGPDGNGSIILPGSANAPILPGTIPFQVAAPFGETRNFGIDPGMELGYSHSFDLTWQRELPGNHLFEVGYVGRVARNLIQNTDFNAVPFMQVDPGSGQTLIQAYQALSNQVRAGATTFTPQPFFENSIGGAAGLLALGYSPTYPSYTAALADFFPFEFEVGDVASVFLFGIDLDRLALGLTPYNNLQAQLSNFTSDGGSSNYHALFFSFRKRSTRGLAWDFNWTIANSRDHFGLNQENTAFSWTSPFFRDLDWEPSLWDIRHAINAHWYYELPFGRGKRFATDNNVADKFIGGWHLSGIFSASSGLPLGVSGYGNLGAFTGFINSIGATNITENSLRTAPSTGTGSNSPSGFNLFSDPAAVYSNFRHVDWLSDTRHGFGALRGFPRWNVDMSIGKTTTFYEKYKMVFTFDLLNAFNHMEWNNPGLDITDPTGFGAISGQFGGSNATAGRASRTIQFGLRVEF